MEKEILFFFGFSSLMTIFNQFILIALYHKASDLLKEKENKNNEKI